MNKIKQNLKRLRRKHTKKLKEKREEETKFLCRLCDGGCAIFSVTLYDSQGNGIVISMEDMEAFLDMEGCDV